MFGAKCSPTCSNYALRRTSRDNKDSFPLEAEVVDRNFYMDDLFKSVPSLLEACSLQVGLGNLLSLDGFRLTKWISNDKDLLTAIPAELWAQSVRTIGEEGILPTKRALGVICPQARLLIQDQAKGVGGYTTESHQPHSINIWTNWLFSPIYCPGKDISSIAVETLSRLGREGSGRNPARMVCLAEGTAESSRILGTAVLSPGYGFSHLHSAALVWWRKWESILRCRILSVWVSKWRETVRLCSCKNPCGTCQTTKYPKTGIASSGSECALSVYDPERAWLWGVLYLLLEWQQCCYWSDSWRVKGTVFVKDERSILCLFRGVSLYERGSGARLNKGKTKAMWLNRWRNSVDEPLGLNWVKKMKLWGTVFGSVDAKRQIWEPRISKREKVLSLWKSRSHSMVGRVHVWNILGLSRLLFVSRVLEPPNWVWARVYSLTRPFLWGSKIETIARETIICPLKEC